MDAPPLLDARGLTKTFVTGRGAGRREVRAVEDVDLVIADGETHGLVGESGSGKTTTGRLVLRLVEPDAGRIAFRGRDLLALEGSELRRVRRDIQLVHQDPYSSVDPRFTARDIVAEPWLTHRLHDRAERRRRADALLERVGIDPVLGDRRPASFSGGQLQRIGIARALALEPALIVCDEPVSALDVSVQGQILNLLLDLKRERGVSYLFIAHDLAVVRHISDRVSVMYRGRIVETGSRADVFERASHPYTQALLGAMLARGPAERDARPPAAAQTVASDRLAGAADADAAGQPDAGCAYRGACPYAQDRCSSEVPALVDRGAGHPVACHFPPPPMAAERSAAHARVDDDDRDVGEEVDERDEEPGDDADAHDEGCVEPA